MFINTWTIFGMVNMKGITGYPQLQRSDVGVYRGEDGTISILKKAFQINNIGPWYKMKKV